jgi:hypothetical protein
LAPDFAASAIAPLVGLDLPAFGIGIQRSAAAQRAGQRMRRSFKTYFFCMYRAVCRTQGYKTLVARANDDFQSTWHDMQ